MTLAQSTAAVAATLIGSLATGIVLTRIVRAYAIRANVVDTPNHRSSHTVTTPRGGGAAIVVISLVAAVLVTVAGLIQVSTALALIVGSGIVAAVGWIDDVKSISAGTRAAAQLAAATWVVFMLGPLPIVTGWLSNVLTPNAAHLTSGVLAVLGITWLTNLFNFMDGIDGIAGATALVVGLTMCGFLLRDRNAGLALVAAAIAGASLGFLVWNWNPAKIFMGDVGSAFLGFTFGTLNVANTAHSATMLWMILPLLPFIVDATFTLIRRSIRGDSIIRAHREHLYQQLIKAGAPHSVVALGYAGLAAVLGLTGAVANAEEVGALPFLATAISATVAVYIGLHFVVATRSHASLSN